MAINIDTVYQKVLAIANKEQRGYINPQQFNLFANQAQLDIFEDYFFKLNQLEFGQKNSTQYADLKTILLEKIQPFEKTGDLAYSHDGLSPLATFESPPDLYRMGSVRYKSFAEFTEGEGVNQCSDPTFTGASGSEMITNGSFTGNANGWHIEEDGDVAYNDNKISFSTLGYGMNGIHQYYSSLASGTKFYKDKTYRVKFTISNHVSGSFRFLIMTGHPGDTDRYYFGVHFPVTTLHDGEYSFDIMPNQHIWGAHGRINLENGIYFYRGGGNTGGALGHPTVTFDIDDISVKEIGNTWTITPSTSWDFGSGGSVTPGGNEIDWVYSTENLGRANSIGLSEGYLQTAMTLGNGTTYSISYDIGDATTGKVFLANHLTTDIADNVIADGTTNNLLLFDASVDAPGSFTKFFTQGATNTDKLSLYKNAEFNGNITNIVVKLAVTATNGVEVQSVRGHELTNILNSKLMLPSTKRPIYIKNKRGINVYPKTIETGISCYYIKKPKTVSWNYTEINSVALYNSNSSVDFELHPSEESNLVIRILTLSGINMKDQALIQIGMAKEGAAK
jgi:hypothetical protein